MSRLIDETLLNVLLPPLKVVGVIARMINGPSVKNMRVLDNRVLCLHRGTNLARVVGIQELDSGQLSTRGNTECTYTCSSKTRGLVHSVKPHNTDDPGIGWYQDTCQMNTGTSYLVVHCLNQ